MSSGQGDSDKTIVREGDSESTVVRSHPDSQPTVLKDGAAATDDGPVTPEAPGRYEVRSEYGRGGQSRVLLAFDMHVQREIALKELLPEGAATGPGSGSQAAAARFVREARITGQLEHPNIVPVYELGRHADGTFYYTQKLVRGTTLRRKISEARTLPERLKLLSHFEDVCHAVAYAHSRGVIHRDLKPENVMVGQFGETVVLDWGLAKARGQKDVRGAALQREAEQMRSADATMAGHALGTPSYMSPEQAFGRLDEIDERSDVWSLGAMLFEMLTGCPPFQGDTAFSVISKVMADEPPRTRAVLREAPPELAAVADKCLSRPREKRYASAEEVAREIEAYLTGGNVRAYQYSSWELLRRFVQRHRALTAVSAGAVVLLVAALLGIRDEAAQARAALQQARHNLAQAYLEKAHIAERDLYWHRAEVFYAAARVQEDTPEARAGAAVDWEDLAAVARLPGAAGFITGVGFSADGRSVLATSWDGTVRRWDVESGRELARASEPAAMVLGFSMSPDRSRALVPMLPSGTDTGRGTVLSIRDAATGAALDRFTLREQVTTTAWSADGKLIAVATAPRHVLLYTADGKPADHEARPGAGAAFSRTGALATCDGKQVFVWDGLQAPEPRRLDVPDAGGCAVKFSFDGKLLAATGGDAAVHLWTTADWKPAGVLRGHLAAIRSIAFSPDGTRLATVSREDRTVRVWDPAAQRQIAQLDRPQAPFTATFSPDGTRLAIGERQGAVVLWDLPSRFRGHEARVTAAVFSPGGAETASASEDGTLRVWDLATGAQKRRIDAKTPLSALAWTPDGALFIAREQQKGGFAVFDASDGRQRGFLAESEPGLLAISPALAATTSNAGGIHLWELPSLKRAAEIRSLRADALLFLPDGTLVAHAEGAGLLRFDARTGARIGALAGEMGAEPKLAATRDGAVVAVAVGDRASLLDARTGAVQRELHQPGASITSLAFSPDGQLLATSATDGTVQLWDPRRGVRVASDAASSDVSLGVSFSPDGSRLLFVANGPWPLSWAPHFVSLGDVAKLPPPQEHLEVVLAEHGLVLQGTELELAAPGAAAPRHEAAAGALSAPQRAR